MNVDVVELPDMRVATVSHRGPYHEIPQAFATLGELAGPAGLFGPSALMLAIYHDDPRTTPAAELRSEAALTVTPGTTLPAGLGESRIAAGRYARTTHVGPYEQLMEVWPRFMKEGIPAIGRKMREGPSLELYRNTPMDVPKEQLITECYVPVE